MPYRYFRFPFALREEVKNDGRQSNHSGDQGGRGEGGRRRPGRQVSGRPQAEPGPNGRGEHAEGDPSVCGASVPREAARAEEAAEIKAKDILSKREADAKAFYAKHKDKVAGAASWITEEVMGRYGRG